MTPANFLTRTSQLILIVALAGLMIVVCVGLIPLPLLLPKQEARAAGTINVTTTIDEYNTSGSGSGCSLREAIESINTSASFGGCNNPGNAADTIQLQGMIYTLSIPETGFPNSNTRGSVKPQRSVIIRGVGPGQTIITTTITFNQHVFMMSNPVVDPATITIEGINIQGGKGGGGGRGILCDFSFENSTLTLTDAVIENNLGGGIGCTASVLILSDVTIRNNGTMNNSGGGLLRYYGNIIMKNVTFYGNQADVGGAIYINDYSAKSDAIQMTNVTIFNNQAQVSGGGLYLVFYTPPNVITATNVTFAKNQAVSGNGGNIYLNASSLSLKNTIIANGSPNNCDGNPVPNITSLGHNLDSGNTCGLTATGDITNTNPLLAASLADNGGSTETLALLGGSPAIDGGTCNGAPAADQRGIARPQGTACDIGAYETSAQPNFFLTKRVDDATPDPGQRITYTITLQNNGSLSATNTTLSDPLPAGLSLAGPARLDPPGSVFTPTLPTLASGLTLSSGHSITLTFPVTASAGLVGGTVLTNTVTVTSTEVVTPQTASVRITIAAEDEEIYLPVILKK
ncbi:MAG: DUF11 domain-containing protein [Anaerolineae bacterium]|nr:DUF11 domain-containing protein [Anaerolineae bacterium]